MKKKYFWNAPLLTTFAIIGLIVGFVVSAIVMTAHTITTAPEKTFVIEEYCDDIIDSSAIDLRGRDIAGTVRMICAERLTDNILVDRSGEAWEVDYPLSANDLYLLWIDDMGNDDIEDDVIINLWICG